VSAPATKIHLSAEDADAFAREVDAMRSETKAKLGASDRAYLLRVIRWQRALLLLGRITIFASIPFMPWVFHHAAAGRAQFFAILGVGAVMLGLSKILENMEIGHNVLHAQWDWMNDAEIHSSTWEWDNVCPSYQWKHSHNVTHHTWTNVVGKDRDVGYLVLRVADQQEWGWYYLFQPLYVVVLAFLFQWGVGLHDIDFPALRDGKITPAEMAPHFAALKQKVKAQLLKDYVYWPLLAGPFFPVVLAANLVANGIRNLWGFVIIFCGHFPGGVHMFTEDDVKSESRGAFYVRQLTGSCNIEGSALFHVLTGNLSHQIEHHLFPDVPSSRHAELAPRVRELAARYGLPYNTGSLTRQFGTTIFRIWKMALPPPVRMSQQETK
jgi:linoleoyl-CoA desaturase